MTTAAAWFDAETWAKSRARAAELYEQNVTIPAQWPDHGPSRDRLLRGLRLAARFTAEVWQDAADDARTFFLDAEAHENAALDRIAADAADLTLSTLDRLDNAQVYPMHICTARNCGTCRR